MSPAWSSSNICFPQAETSILPLLRTPPPSRTPWSLLCALRVLFVLFINSSSYSDISHLQEGGTLMIALTVRRNYHAWALVSSTTCQLCPGPPGSLHLQLSLCGSWEASLSMEKLKIQGRLQFLLRYVSGQVSSPHPRSCICVLLPCSPLPYSTLQDMEVICWTSEYTEVILHEELWAP